VNNGSERVRFSTIGGTDEEVRHQEACFLATLPRYCAVRNSLA
jgi:hypothetical protein